MSKKPKPCRWCAEGHEIRSGQHWIVKSLLPAHIVIKECTATKSASRSSSPAGEN